MTMKIRHVLDTKDIYAVYFLDPPQETPTGTMYSMVAPCLYMALVTRPEDDNPQGDPLDEIIGFVIDSTIVPADETPSDNLSFMWYVDKNNVGEWFKYINELVPAWAKAAYEQQNPPVIEIPPVILQQTTKSRKRR